jgi:hypothetical protein
MATNIVSTSYTGEYKDKIVGKSLMSGDTLKNGGVTVYPDIAHKEVIKKITLGDDLMVAGTCDYTDAGTVTVAEAILEMKEYQINKTECVRTFRQDWLAEQMSNRMMDRDLPKSYSDFIVAYYLEKIAKNIEVQIWQGDGTGANLTGFTTNYAADDSVLLGGAKIAAIGGGVNASNVVDEIAKVVNNVASNQSSLLAEDDFFIYVGADIFQHYLRSLGGFAANGVGGSGYNNQGSNQDLGSNLLFDGIKIFRAPGIPANQMVAAQKSNLVFGCGFLGDLSELKIIDTSETLGDQNFRFVNRFKMGIQTIFKGEVTYYG